jgi:hypothetical protein
LVVITFGASPRISSPASLTLPEAAHEPGHGVAERRLAHAVAADDGQDATVQRERHALQRMRTAVIDVQVLDLEDQCARAPM